jgi:hypothetical protein
MGCPKAASGWLKSIEELARHFKQVVFGYALAHTVVCCAAITIQLASPFAKHQLDTTSGK